MDQERETPETVLDPESSTLGGVHPQDGPDRTSRTTVVALCGSAGGLGAFDAFFEGLSCAPDRIHDLAFVVVQHIAPDRPSLLTEILQRHTSLEVEEIREGSTLRPGHVFVIPPDREIGLENDTFRTMPFEEPRPKRQSIDNFLRSLAWSHGERAVVAVLSGTGSDGSVGLEAIKQRGGYVLAQVPESAEFSGMPQSAIATGLVDSILPPARMADQILSYLDSMRPPSSRSVPSREDEATLLAIFDALQVKLGHDFTQYKTGTLHRRVTRRMAVHQVESLEEYARLIEESPGEATSLFRELLIGVTKFYRDPDVFQALAEKVVPGLFENRSSGHPIRVWVPGCATGEEAYGIAMLLAEHQDSLGVESKIQVYATDIDARAIAVARAGIYSPSIVADIPGERLDRFFTRRESDGSYRIQKRIREMLIFSEQNLTRDPPFSRIDLVSCRNLLIYMGADLQRKLIAMFHAALNPRGVLLLGSSEHVGDHADFFVPVDRGAKIYRRLETSRRSLTIPSGTYLPHSLRSTYASVPSTPTSRASTLRDFTERSLLAHAVPTALLLNSEGDILYQHGRAGRYLELPADAPGTVNALRMAKDGLRFPLATAMRKAVAESQATRSKIIRIKGEDVIARVALSVRPVPQADLDNPLPGAGSSSPNVYLVVLEELGESREETGEVDPPSSLGQGGTDDLRLADLLHELEVKDEHLQASREALESSNEDLTASNEELQSMNEELQSANEELETSKEELQSVYEELTTVNAELQAKLADLSRANDDMLNLLAGTGIATIFVDRQLKVMRFTPEATRIVNLIPTDSGRPIGHILSNLTGYGSLVEDIASVVESLEVLVRDVQTHDGAWYVLRIQPYRTQEGAVEGAVVTFSDVTERKRMESRILEQESRLRAVLESCPEPIYLKDRHSRIMLANQATFDVIGRTAEEVIGLSDMEFYPDRDMSNAILDNDRHVMETGEALTREEVVPGAEGERIFLSSKAPWRNADGVVMGLVGVSRDVTESRRITTALKASEALFRNLVENLPVATYVSTGTELIGEYLNPRFTELFGYVLEDVPTVESWWPLAYPDPVEREAIAREWNRRVAESLSTGGVVEPMETIVTSKDGSRRNILWTFYSLGGKHYSCGQDLTEIRRGENALQASLAEKDRLLRELHQRESEARRAANDLKVVMESMPAFTFVARDPECKVLESSVMALQRMRISPEIKYSPDIPHDQKPRSYKVMQDGAELAAKDFPLRRAIREKREIHDEEIQILFPDGEELHLFGSAVPLLDENGEVRGGVGAFIDITPQKRGAEELRRSQAELSLVLDNTAEAIAFLDTDRRLVWANRAYLSSVAGRPDAPAKLEEIRGKRCIDVWGLPKFCDDCPVEKCLGSCEVEEAFLTNQSQSHWTDTFGSWQVRAAPVRDAAGKVVGSIEVARSIAERLQMEGQIRQSEKLAAVGQLAGGVAHNFNNQLTGMMGYADLLLLKLEAPELRTLAEGVKSAASRAAELTSQLLAFARKGHFQKIPLDVDRIIVETGDLLRQTVDRRIRIETRCGAQGTRTIGDPSQIHNALLNLGLNARDAMPEGGTLRISSRPIVLEEAQAHTRGVAPGRYLQVEVADTGTGMPQDILARIFEPFFTTKPVGQGTGLGLASVHGTVVSMGGAIEVKSEEGRGTTFTLLFPGTEDLADPAPREALRSVGPGRKIRILLVDDEEVILVTCKAMLEQMGYDVSAYTDPLAAVAFHAANYEAIDLVILDLVMPGMGGREALAAIRRVDPRARVVISSGYSLDEHHPALGEGVAAFLQKPFNMSDLAERVAEAVAVTEGARDRGESRHR